MLTVAAGPTAMTAINGESLVDCSQGFSGWIEGYGLLFETAGGSADPNKYYLCNTDGKAIICNTANVGGAVGYDYLGNVYASGAGWGAGHSTFKLYPPACCPANATPDYAGANPGMNFALLSGRTIYCTNHQITTTPLPAGSGFANEFACPAAFASGAATCQIHPYLVNSSNSLWYCCNPGSGNGYIFLYDANAKAMVPNSLTRVSVGVANASIAYSAKHNMFFVLQALGGTLYLTTYINDPVASNLSAPSFVTPPSIGATVGVTTTLTGADGEPCVNRAITFTSTVGTFVLPTVLTNSSGVATALFEAPVTTSAGDTCTATLLE